MIKIISINRIKLLKHDSNHKWIDWFIVILQYKKLIMKKTILILFISVMTITFYSCNSTPTKDDFKSTETTETPTAGDATATNGYDPERGEGKFTKVEVSPTLDQAMAASGEKIVNVKCGSCHKMTDERLVGPGWKGVSTRKSPEWIMNFITNPDAMIDKDPEVQAQLEICLVRMPNQSLTDDDARHIYEFMRKNDGVK